MGAMRIVAGTLKGRRLLGPPTTAVRPTSDALRETLFNVLGPTLDGARVLDAYAGTGALGLEAISRGAAQATFVERDRAMIRVLEANVRACRVENACVIIRDDFLTASHRVLPPAHFDLVMLDPPYADEALDRALARAAVLAAPQGRVVLEHSRRRASPDEAGRLARVRLLVAGDSALSFYERPADH
jgi:16S rRNA (guanine(966)-N(2))-methyltransferase RsmD